MWDRDEALKARLTAAQKRQVWALKSEDVKRIGAMIDLARSEPGLAVTVQDLDRAPWLLNCPNGTLDLRTGRMREHRREYLITQLCPVEYEAAATCPLWDRTLFTIFGGKADLVGYFQRLCGYCLTGDTREQILAICWGTGSNGKSLVFETLLDVLGKDYAGVGGNELLMSGNHEPHPTYLADLFGKRMVTLAETREGGRLNETLIKRLTGGGTIRARRMREDSWSFTPTHKIVLATNHKPEVRGTDHGIWRRLRLLPFTVRFWDGSKGESGPLHLQADKTLRDRLRTESAGILAWMVRGCLDWQASGLREPREVLSATEEYRGSQDLLAGFIRDRCDTAAGYSGRASDLYAAFRRWHEASGERGEPMSLRRFGEQMREKGHDRKTSNGVWYQGIRLTVPAPDSPWDGQA